MENLKELAISLPAGYLTNFRPDFLTFHGGTDRVYLLDIEKEKIKKVAERETYKILRVFKLGCKFVVLTQDGIDIVHQEGREETFLEAEVENFDFNKKENLFSI